MEEVDGNVMVDDGVGVVAELVVEEVVLGKRGRVDGGTEAGCGVAEIHDDADNGLFVVLVLLLVLVAALGSSRLLLPALF